LLFENYGQKVGGQYIVGSPNLKWGDQSPPVPMVVAPMAWENAISTPALPRLLSWIKGPISKEMG